MSDEITSKDIQTILVVDFAAYIINFPEEKDDVVECAKVLEKVLNWRDSLE